MGDVAAMAGVSLKSVSRVVNRERHVSADLEARVRRAIASLDYRPDWRARDLASALPSAPVVGLVEVDAANPWFAAVHRGLEDATRDAGVVVLSGSTDADPAREASLIETFIRYRVQGVVVAAAEGADALLRSEIERGIHVVCVDRQIPGARCDVVVTNNRSTTRSAVMHLSEVGHKRIAFLGGNEAIWTARERLAGYRDALKEADLSWDERLEILGVDSVDAAREATKRLLETPTAPTALFTAQDRITIGAVTALHGLGRQHDVALLGFDEVPFSETLSPSVAVIAQDPYEMGRRAGMLLLDRLAGGPARRLQPTVVDAHLLLRESADIRPGKASAHPVARRHRGTSL